MIFTANTTDGLNIAINGFGATEDDEIITTDIEHNSVARPLNYLSEKGVIIKKIITDENNGASAEEIEKAITAKTKFIVITHASNVTGVINDIKKIGEVAKAKCMPLVVDAAQTAGVLPIDVQKMNISVLAFPGHKGLLSPTGTGGLYIAEEIKLNHFKAGGTGVFSEDPFQPEELPFKFEAGTVNYHGIAGLYEGAKYILENREKILQEEKKLTEALISELKKISGITIYAEDANRVGTVSVNLEGFDSADLAAILDSSFGIAVRSGLHCAPDTHKKLGTIETGGTLRISIGAFTTNEDISAIIAAFKEILG
jgi:cysteine desulfurase family protein